MSLWRGAAVYRERVGDRGKHANREFKTRRGAEAWRDRLREEGWTADVWEEPELGLFGCPGWTPGDDLDAELGDLDGMDDAYSRVGDDVRTDQA